MKAIRFLPLVFFVGIDGFAMFAPYALLVMLVSYAAARGKQTPQLIPVRVSA